MRATSTTLLALLSMVGVASAQSVQPVATGARVRVTTADNPSAVVGELVAVNDSALLVRRQVDSNDVSIPRSLVHRLEVSRGTSRGTSARRGALIGLAIGGMVGFLAGEDCSSEDFICFDRGSTAAIGMASGVSIGGLIGLVTGGAERWRDTAVPMTLSVVPTAARSMSIVSRIAF
jgi:hypothetical protein